MEGIYKRLKFLPSTPKLEEAIELWNADDDVSVLRNGKCIILADVEVAVNDARLFCQNQKTFAQVRAEKSNCRAEKAQRNSSNTKSETRRKGAPAARVGARGGCPGPDRA